MFCWPKFKESNQRIISSATLSSYTSYVQLKVMQRSLPVPAFSWWKGTISCLRQKYWGIGGGTLSQRTQGWILLPGPRAIVLFLTRYFSRVTVKFANLLLRLHFPLGSVGHMAACVAVKGDFLGVEQHPLLPVLPLSFVQLPGCSDSTAEPWGAFSSPIILQFSDLLSPPVLFPDPYTAAQVVCCVWTSALLFLPFHFKHTHKPTVLQQSHPEWSNKPKQIRQWPFGP